MPPGKMWSEQDERKIRKELDESAEEANPNEYQQKEPAPVAYTEKVPLEFFDFIVILRYLHHGSR